MPRRRISFLAGLGVLVAITVGACTGAPAPKQPGDSTLKNGGAAPQELVIDTPPANKAVAQVTWPLYRDVRTVDPIFAFDYPENTVDAALCDTLFRQAPDGAVGPGLASKVSYPSPTTMVLTLRSDVRFWDGSPMAAEDVVYSLQRNMDSKLGGFYDAVFDRVSSIRATGADQVTIMLTKPDYWLEGELSATPGSVIEKRYAQAKGEQYGTPAGGAMCTGPYKIKSWNAGEGLVAVRNNAYWDQDIKPLVEQFTFKGVSDTATVTGLLTGSIGMEYTNFSPTLDQFRQSPKLNVYLGPSFVTDALVVTNLDGALGDVRVRRALSMMIDRPSYNSAVYRGAAQLPRALANPGTWGYARQVFQDAWNALPEPSPNVAEARKLVNAAGAEGKTIVLGTSDQLQNIKTASTAVAAAGDKIGLNVRLKSVPAANYINFFTDAEARKGIDGMFTASYPDYADPAAEYKMIVLPGGSLNYSGWQNADVSRLLEQARQTPDATARAKLVVAAQKIIMSELPWIPMSSPSTVLVMQKSLTGAPASFSSFMYAPWGAVRLGGTG